MTPRRKTAGLALAVAVFGAGLAVGAALREEPAKVARPSGSSSLVAVSPQSGGSTTTFRVTARARSQDNLADGRHYQFVLNGPGERDCQGRLYSSVGLFPTEEHPGVTVAHYAPSRVHDPIGPTIDRATWCPGNYDGYVEYRDTERGARSFEVIGRFSFKVE